MNELTRYKNNKLRGKTVVITGASSGIGRASALTFAENGCNVVICSRQKSLLEEVANTCETLGGRALAIEADVSEASDCEKVAAAAKSKFGRIDIWINNAGVYIMGKFDEIPADDFERVMEVNYLGTVYGCKAAIPYMKKQKRGVIINVASVAGKNGYKYATAYNGSKFAVVGFSQALRQECDDWGIEISTIMPASTDTPLFQHSANYVGKEIKAMPPVATAQHVANVIAENAITPKREVFATADGRVQTSMHTLAGTLFERAIPKQVEKNHLYNKKASFTEGNLYSPDSRYPQVSGGWKMRYDNEGPNGRDRRGARGGAFGGALALGAAGAGLWYLFGRDGGQNLNTVKNFFSQRVGAFASPNVADQPEPLPGSINNPAADIA